VLVFGGSVVSIANEQQFLGPTTVVQLTGLAGVKENAKGTLSVETRNLHFVHGKTRSDVSATSIEDFVTGSDSQKTVGMLSMAAPYGGGRFLSLFRTKIDTLTIPMSRSLPGSFKCLSYECLGERRRARVSITMDEWMLRH
jgi:hypothetical protein